jgi:hypothetical protein
VTAILAHRLVEAPAIALGKRLAMQTSPNGWSVFRIAVSE